MVIHDQKPNSNCLEGLRCPVCGSYGPFKIKSTGWVCWEDDGTDITDYPSWDFAEDSGCICLICNHDGRVESFRNVPDNRFRTCKFCGGFEHSADMHLHDDQWVCTECWDERLRAAE